VGREERAERLVADLEARFAALRESHPHWADRTLLVATHRGEGDSAFASEDPRSRFFRDLGFRIPEEIDRLAGDSFFVELSREQARLLDRDVLVWDQVAVTPGGRATIEGDPLARGLAVTRQGRSPFLEGRAGGRLRLEHGAQHPRRPGRRRPPAGTGGAGPVSAAGRVRARARGPMRAESGR
jgi:iron complex transport system substrate-binding protein